MTGCLCVIGARGVIWGRGWGAVAPPQEKEEKEKKRKKKKKKEKRKKRKKEGNYEKRQITTY